jgi:hypothetical protein
MCPASFHVTFFPKVAAIYLRITHGLDYVLVAFSMKENKVYHIFTLKKVKKFFKKE